MKCLQLKIEPQDGSMSDGHQSNIPHDHISAVISSVVLVLQVQRLVEMGFSRDNVMQAMRVANNDITLATNVLLQQS